MGFELDRLMKQYGVATPSLNYSGSAIPVAPVAPTAPVNPNLLSTVEKQDKDAYDSLLAKYNTNKSIYDSDRALYDIYKTDYQNRMQNTPMYLQKQFDTSAKPQTYTPATTVKGLYNQYLKREPDAGGLEFWNKGFGDFVDPLERSSFLQAASPEISKNNLGSNELYDLTKSYWGGNLTTPTYGKMPVVPMAEGGVVKTHYQTGGAKQPNNIDQVAENYDVAPQLDIMRYQGSKMFPMQEQVPVPISNQMTRRDAYPPTPQSPMDARSAQLDALLQRYAGTSTDYSSELAEARKAANTESMAFKKMIQDAMKAAPDEAPSKAEMYFRLASAFGSPTKTGHFAETLGNVNKELASYSKEERDAKKAQRALQLQMGLKGQEMRMASAKDDLTTLKTLAAEGMKDKRAITAEIIKDFIKSGEPESAAGKQAKDEGLKPGTKEYQARVSEIAQTSVDAKLAQVTATLAGMSVQQANANLAIQKFQNLQEQQTKLTPAEVALKTQTEDMLGSTTQAMNDLKRAYELNPNTFDASLPDIAQRKLLETAGSKDPKLANTREQINLLEKGALAQLKSTFPGAISDAETRTLKELQGINAKSIEERGRIMKNAFRALKAIDERSKRRLDEIKRGTYRDTTPTPEGLE